MINVSILYPFKEGGHFDLDYYLKTHMPLSIEKLRPALRGVSIEHGLGAAGSDAPPAFTVICQLRFDSVEAFFEVFSPHPCRMASGRHQKLYRPRSSHPVQRGQAAGAILDAIRCQTTIEYIGVQSGTDEE